jgi:polysaccharide export outer membrane protein
LPLWLITAETVKPVFLFASLALSLGGCSWVPSAGPSASEVVEQAQPQGEILFDVVEVDDHVVATLRAQPKERFAARFGHDTQPPAVKIAIGDVVSVVIWESAAGGLFTESPSTLPPGAGAPRVEPLAPEAPRQELGAPGAPEQPQQRGGAVEGAAPRGAALPPEATGATAGGQAVHIPLQLVQSDGTISVPYAGRIPAAGRSPAEVQQTIQARLANRALQPQAIVIVVKSFANTVTVTGEVVAGTQVPLSLGGNRLLEVIAAAGGAKAPVYETFVRLSRNGVTATIPLQQLVSDPAENIYAWPGDVLTLVQVPQTFSVFGATGRNAQLPFDAERISLGEALGKSQGLRDDLAKPEGVFLFRYEPNAVVRALGQPIASTTSGGVSPIVYRFDLRDGKSYLLAQQFPVYDKDVIFVADAPAVRSYKFATLLSSITGPIITGLLVCQNGKC